MTFLFYTMELKVRLLWMSNDGEADDYHDQEVVQRKFLQAIQTGLLSDSINCQVRPFLNDVRVSDETLIDKMSEADSLEGERKS